MNISSVGSPAPATSTRISSACHVAASQRLLQLNQQQGSVHSVGSTPFVVPDKDRLVPSRKREERIAIQNLQRRLELGKILHSSVNEEFMGAVFGHKLTMEKVSPFLKRLKICSNQRINYMHNEENFQDNDFIQEALLWHNIYRQHHDSPPLKLSYELYGKAQAWANHLAHTNTLLYENDKSVGENIFYRFSADTQTEISAQEIVSYWYSSYKNYMYNKKMVTLHVNVNAAEFTQLVWKSTKYFGIGRARSRVGKIFVVGKYKPAGNVVGLFQENVLPRSNNKDFT